MKNTMRYTFALLLLTAGLCSCQKENLGGSLNGETPICVSPVTRLATKAPVAGTTFPDSRTMVMSASYNPETGSASNYFSGISFSKVGSTWSSDKFWPLSGSLNLFAYSIDGLTAGSAVYETNVSEGITLGIPDNSTAQTDILWGYAAEQTYNASGNAMAFNHAAASLAFTAKCSVPFDASTNKGISIQSIVVKGVKNSGTVKLNNDMTCVWSSLGDSKDLTLPGLSSSYQVPGTASTAAFGVGETGLIVLPQSATSFEVTYTIHNGKDGSGNKIDNSGMKFSFTCEGDWVYGKKYTYALNFNLNSVSVAPSVIDWTDGGSTDVDIPKKVVATYAMKADAGEEASLPKVNMTEDSQMGVEWGDDKTDSYKAESDTTITAKHTYDSAYDGIVNITAKEDSELEFQVTAEEKDKLTIVDEEIAKKKLDEPYALCFSADKEDQLLLTNFFTMEPGSPLPSLTLQYSYDNNTWNTWETTTVELFGEDVPTYAPLTIGTAEHPKVYIRGKNTSGFNYMVSEDDHSLVMFMQKLAILSISDPSVVPSTISCSGNIMSLIDYENESLLEIPCNACFAALFTGMFLTSAPILPATTLTEFCYESMFQGCTLLTIAPELPATTLAYCCYGNMFDGSGIINAPTLSATTLAPACYSAMFQDCCDLITPPALPATSLAEDCYGCMFNNCTSLTTAPELPATVLAECCYESMFKQCTSLTTAPELPATILADNCYYGMFNSCENITSVTMKATDVSADECLTEWLNNAGTSAVSPTLYVDPSMVSNSTITANKGNFTVTAIP